MSKDYIWNLTDLKNVEKNGRKVFTTFSCGGGSSMGYKLAGYEVLGNCEIDPQINAMYVKNHHPKYNYLMGVQDFYKEENRKNIPEELYHLDILDGSPPCFIAGTKVKTIDGYKNIEDIRIGDRVYTHNGKYQFVYNVMSKIADNCYEVKVQGSLPITVTGNHPFYVRTMVRSGKYGERKFSEPYWKPAEALSIERNNSNTIRSQDYVGIPVNTKSEIFEWDGIEYEHHIYGKKVVIKKKKDIRVDNPVLWFLIGRYIGDGWRRHDRKEVLICCAKHEREDLEQIIKNAGYNAVFSEEKATFKALISNAELYYFLQRFGDKAYGKKIPEEVLNLPDELLEQFMYGYLSADGHYEQNESKWRCASVSYDLILGLQAIIAKIWKQPVTITSKLNMNTIQGRSVNTKRAYDISFFVEKHIQQHSIYENGYLWVPFRKATPIDGHKVVYNMSVENDESYTVNNIAVHNCSTFSMAGGREKFWGKEKHFREGQAKQVLDDLFFEFLKVVELLKPKVVVAENVKGMVGGNARGYVNLIFKRFAEIGYDTQLFLLNSATMGVPQKRERVFFIARRKDLNFPKLVMQFNEKPILYREFASEDYKPLNKDTMTYERWLKRSPKDNSLGDTVARTENGKVSGFTASYLKLDSVCPTVTAGGGALLFDKPGYPSDRDIICMQSFPQDYDFNGNDVTYVCGMSVPPLMMKGVASEIYKQWFSKE